MRTLLALGLILQIAASHMDVAGLASEIERAVVTGEAGTLERARQRLLSDIQRADPLPLARYTLAYVDWRLTYVRGERSGPDRTRLFEEAEAQLRTIIDADASDAESLALLGTIYGARIADGGSAMRLGPRAIRAISGAAARAPDNPRVALLRGIHFFFTPSAFGGGLDAAEAELRRAEQLFTRQRAEHPWPNWGRVDTLAWLGQVLAKKRDYPGARAAYDRALAIDPNHVWIRSLRAALDGRPRRRDAAGR